MDAIQAIGITAVIILFYFLPTFIATGKKNGGGIFVLNLTLGWTLVGWIGALIWAMCSPVVNKK